MTTNILRLALAQINCTVGDITGNCARIKANIKNAHNVNADIIVFPELAICGYPPEDLLLKKAFIEDNLRAVKELAVVCFDMAAVVGFVDKKNKDIYNAAAVIYRGKVRGVYHKMLLPNYGVFDEKRYFAAGVSPVVFRLGELNFGVNICEDIWNPNGPTKKEASIGARLILNINASPYHRGKMKEREDIVCKQAKSNKVHFAYLNLVGGQDELVFDGQSIIVSPEGKIIARAEAFKEDLLIADLEIPGCKPRLGGKNIITLNKEHTSNVRQAISLRKAKALEPVAEVYEALKLGLGDYAGKNGFKKAVIGLSGGIDSALVAAIAVDTLGKENVTCVFMPSRYSSEESLRDAQEVAGNLGIKLMNIPIETIYKAYLLVLDEHFSGFDKNIAEENIQARIRGNLLMALSNKFAWLVLTTGNKSEMSTGYATLYGDMAGGLAVIKDVPKMLVYQLARYRNKVSAVIPENVLIKAPTAELRPNQKDADSLPLYETLDPILKAYIEEDKEFDQIVSLGFAPETVRSVMGMVEKSEYKRRQSPPGIKITPKAFGKDRRMPITNKFIAR